MLIIEWLLMLPNGGGTTVVKKTVTNFDATADAVSRAHALWPAIQAGENGRASGFQVVDQDGRIMAAACFSDVDVLAA